MKSDTIATIFITSKDLELKDIIRENLKKYSQFLIEDIEDADKIALHPAAINIAGIIIDIRDAIKLSSEQKGLLNSIESSIPILKIRYNKNSQSLSGLMGDTAVEGEQVFEKYLKKIESLDDFRSVRKFNRTQRHFNIKLFLNEPSQFEKVNSINVSVGGIFIASTILVKRGDLVHVEFLERPSIGRVPAEVRWAIPWGSTVFKMAGFGIKFNEPILEINEMIFAKST